MGLSASQGRLLLLTAKQSDLEFRAQQISQKRLVLAQQLEEISKDYEDATSNRVMSISLYNNEKDVDGKPIQTSCNLSYKNLMSGTLNSQAAAEAAGLKYEKQDKYSNNIYKLVDASGATVVSSVDEILTDYKISETTDQYPSADELKLKNSSGQSLNMYEAKEEKTVEGELQDGSSSKFYVVATGDLATLFNTLSKDDKSVEFSKSGYVRIKDSDGNYKIYNTQNGKVDTSDAAKKATFESGQTATLVQKKDDVPSSHITTETVQQYHLGQGVELVQGGDGKYTLKVNGSVKARFIVDEALQGGSNSAADPNYLQDCLRNGKYILEQYHTNTDSDEPTWDKVSWDATSNIADRYYTEDDASAKAKYDRKQTEIQNADKKLELELDNVESQRNAVKTEIESVEKVINDNIDKSFKTFA